MQTLKGLSHILKQLFKNLYIMILDANKTKKRNAQVPLDSSDVFESASKKSLDKTINDIKKTLNDNIALVCEFESNGDCTVTAGALNSLIKADKPMVQLVTEGAVFSPLYMLIQSTATDVYKITFALAEPDETDGYAVSEYEATGIEYPVAEETTFTKTTL